MSVRLEIDASDLQRTMDLVSDLGDFQSAPLMEEIAALGESQTRRRITDEKTAPDGSAWPDNLAGTSILQDTGTNLLDSIAFSSGEDVAEWGASWEFAHVHQFGAVIKAKNAPFLSFAHAGGYARVKEVTIPERPFVGISDENVEEIRELVTGFFGSEFGAQ